MACSVKTCLSWPFLLMLIVCGLEIDIDYSQMQFQFGIWLMQFDVLLDVLSGWEGSTADGRILGAAREKDFKVPKDISHLQFSFEVYKVFDLL